MTDAEFSDWLADEVTNGRMAPPQRLDILQQKANFDADRTSIEQNYQGSVAGYIDGLLQVADSVDELFERAAIIAPGRMVYFEPIGFVLF